MKRKKVVITERDLKILIFLWRWRYVTTSAISEKFFHGLHNTRGYIRLLKLKKRGYIQSVQLIINLGYAWTLTKKGYLQIKETLPELTDDNFLEQKPNQQHLASAVLIGEWLQKVPSGCALYSRQQLRMKKAELHPKWVPQCDFYTPDGYWYISSPTGSESIIAIGVELHRSPPSKYDRAKDFIEVHTKIKNMLWIVRGLHLAEAIHHKLNYRSDRSEDLHQFVLMDDIFKHNWASQIKVGAFTGLSIHKFIEQNRGNTPADARLTKISRCLVETRLSHPRSVTYKPKAKTRILD